jgi:hypothetical protein
MRCYRKVSKRAHNPKVRGSNPLPATKNIKGLANFVSPSFLSCYPVCYPISRKKREGGFCVAVWIRKSLQISPEGSFPALLYIQSSIHLPRRDRSFVPSCYPQSAKLYKYPRFQVVITICRIFLQTKKNVKYDLITYD